MPDEPYFKPGDRVVIRDLRGNLREETLWKRQVKGRAEDRWLLEGMGPNQTGVSEYIMEKAGD